MKEVRNTIQRGLVLNAVRQLQSHPSASDIYAHIYKEHPTISRGTVYRNLNLLAEAGEIRRVEIADAADRFDFTLAEHYHVLCRACGKVDDIETSCQKALSSYISDAHGYRIDRYEIVFKGICPACLKKQEEGL